MEKITQDRGLHFDPAIVDVFKKIEMGFARIYAENVDEQNENAAAPNSEATA